MLRVFIKYCYCEYVTVEYAQIISTEDQRPDTTSPVMVIMNQNDGLSGIEHTVEKPGDIRISESGVYVVIAAPQIGRTSGETPRYVDFWLRKNGKDLAHSNVRAVVRTSQNKDVVVNQSMTPFSTGDVINLMMSVEVSDEGLGLEAITPQGEPMIPSVIFSMHKIKESNGGRWISTGKGTGKLWVE